MDTYFVRDFNSLVNNIEFVSFAEKSLIENRLKLIPDQLNLDISSIEANIFISNIHKVLIQSCDVKSELLWTIIDVLTKLSSQNEWVQKLAIEYKFPFVLVKLILSVSLNANEGQLMKILRLLQRFTFVEPVKYLEQPYLEAIIIFLLDSIQNRKDEISRISLSVLVNICSKNENASYILSKNVNTTTFAKQHKDHGILSYKIFIILEGISTLKAKDIQELLILSFEDIKKAVKTFDSLTIEHCLDSFISIKDVKDINLKIQDKNICDDLASLLQILMENLPPSSSTETKSAQNFFYIRVLKILDCLLILDPHLCSLLDDFLKLCVENVTNYDYTFYDSLSNLLATYFQCEVDNPKELIAIIFDIFIPFAVKFHLNNKNVCAEDIAFWRFLSSIVSNMKLDKEKIFALVNNEFFDSYFKDLLDDSVEIDLSDRKVMAYIEGIKTLADFSQNCPKLFYAKLEETIRLKPVVMLLAKGNLLGDASIITTIFGLSKLPEFPMKQVADMIIHQRKILELTKFNGKSDNNENEVFRTNQIYKLLADNTTDLISKIEAKLESNQNICSSEIIALYEYKINFANDMIKNLNDNLKQASENNVKLMQQMRNFGDVINKQDAIHFKMELKNERLMSELKTMEQSMQVLKSSLVNFQNKIDSKDKKCSTLQKSLDVKLAEIHDLQNEKADLVKNYNDKVKKLEEMKNSLKESEKNLKDAQKKLSSYEAEESQQKEKILSLEKEISKSNMIVSSLQSDLSKKQEQLDQYEIELKESEAMRQTIMNLMSGTKSRSKK